MYSAEDCAEAGWAFLKKHLGKAAVDRLDYDLDVASKDNCPLSQATGLSYNAARRKLGLSQGDCIEMGFSYHTVYALEEIPELNQAWRALIRLHR